MIRKPFSDASWRGLLSMACLVSCLIEHSASPAEAGVKTSVETYRSGDDEVTVEVFATTKKGKHPAVLLLHGSGGLQQATGTVFRGVAKSMSEKGFVVLIPHFFDRKGETPEWVVAVHDAIEFAAARDDVDAENVGILGFSLGAYLAFYHGARDARVKAVVSLSGSLPVGSQSKFPPTLILHGSKDTSTPVAIVRQFEESLKERDIPCEVHIYEKTGHNFESTKFPDVGRRATTFFQKHLKKVEASEKNGQGKADGGSRKTESH